MSAKVKSHPTNPSKNNYYGRPKKVSHQDFQKVYWPFIPVLISVCVLLTLAVQVVPIHHLTGRVMGYQTSENAQKLLDSTNAKRLLASERKLSINDQLTRAAQLKADDMAQRNYWNHSTPEGTAPWTFVSAAGYKYQAFGENLAAGFSNDTSIVNAWMASPEHRANILNSNYSDVGFGYANSSSFSAIGGGSATIVVAFYAQPTDSTLPVSAAQAGIISGTGISASPRIASIIGGSFASTWAPLAMVVVAMASLLIFIERHRRYFKNAIKKSERYVLRHPATDIGLIIIAVLAILLLQTAGFIL